jgi:hypothetical protein
MAAKLRPRVILPCLVSSTAVALLKPAAVSFSGLLGSALGSDAMGRIVDLEAAIRTTSPALPPGRLLPDHPCANALAVVKLSALQQMPVAVPLAPRSVLRAVKASTPLSGQVAKTSQYFSLK